MAQSYVAYYMTIKHYQNKLLHCQFLKMQLIYKRKSMYKLNINTVTKRRHIYTLKKINYKMYKFSNIYTLHREVTFIIL
jgi:hypothetical protein